MIDELRPREERVDRLRSLCWIGLGKKLANLIGGRLQPDQVERHAPQEFFIAR